MQDCIFCKIANGEIPVEKIYEDDDVLAFPDMYPAAPVHILIIPKKHFPTTLAMTEEAPELFASMMKASAEVAKIKGVDKSGFRLILNTNADAGQEIFHVHMHLLGGKHLGPMLAK